MGPLKARVRNGRLLVDEPTDLPDGTELELVPSTSDDLDEADRALLHAALAASQADVEEGRVRPADAILADLQR